ncbi:MAG: PadR family transcriptional regulator [Jatrophihabitans sp.]|uniref:PadR family transcriptional regulator n=1 Tax=Jatrophihabitans sp. TaxID=1932789 RepID=UPI003F7D4460
MALEHAILVSLSERASTGYELARRFDKSIGRFWTATHQQVYKVLGRMDEAGWVTAEQVAQEGRPDKKVYRVTDAGRAELRAWIGAPTEPEVGRSDLAVKIRGASHGELPGLLDEIERHRALRQERLDSYLANEKREFPDPTRLHGRELHQWLVLRGGISLERGLIEWYDEVLAVLRPTLPGKGTA